MLIDIAKCQLRKAGWYEGRKINLTEYEEGYRKLGCELFPAARRFLEEFGDLTIRDIYEFPYIKSGVSCKESSTQLSTCVWSRHFELEKRIDELYGQKILCVGAIDCCNIYIYISEDGKFYCDWYNYGLLAENSDQLWNEYYGEDYGRTTWEDLKAGKGRTMYKKKVKKYL